MQFRDIVIAVIVAGAVGVGAFVLLNRVDPMKLVPKAAPETEKKSGEKTTAPSADEGDPHKATHFWLSRTEVTVGQFKRFLRESGYEYAQPLWEGPFGVRAVSPRDDSPMVNVNLRDARAFWDADDSGAPGQSSSAPCLLQPAGSSLDPRRRAGDTRRGHIVAPRGRRRWTAGRSGGAFRSGVPVPRPRPPTDRMWPGRLVARNAA